MGSRQTKLTVDLSGEQVSIRQLEATEALGQPFAISINIVVAHTELDLLPHLGKAATVALYEDDILMRYFSGIIVEGEYLSERHDGFHYRLSLRPFTYFMAHNRDFAIFQEMTAIDIAKEVMGKHPSAKMDAGKLTKTYTRRDYCVQYGESDFAFLTRLFEEEGIYYYFVHTDAAHEMVLCDAPTCHEKGKQPTLTFNNDASSVSNVGSAARMTGLRKDFIFNWTERVSTGGEAKVSLRDFDFKKAGAPIEIGVDAEDAHVEDVAEVYDYPGRYIDQPEGQALGQAMLDARRANRRLLSGESQALGLSCGRRFGLIEHPNKRFNTDYLITRTHHATSVEQERSGDEGVGSSTVFIEAVPADVAWRIMPTVPRPVVKGPETAIVTGPDNEEIFTDEYGRVKVRFHWDRSATPGERTTCWIRVSQTGGLGNIILPRVGHEVIVDFLNGDPDRPIVVGRVFNSLNMPVYPLPDNKTKALWRTKSYLSTTSSDLPDAEKLDVDDVRANELRFEDKNGEEEVFIHAERDMNTRIRYKESHHIGLDQEIKIGRDRSEFVKRHDTVEIQGSRKVTIEEDDTLDVQKNIKVDSGSEISITAQAKITLKVGSSSITIDPAGIKIEAPATLDAKSAMTTVKGDGMLTLKGGMTMIN